MAKESPDESDAPYSQIEEQEPSGPVTCWTRFTMPQYALHRYVALALMCFMGFGNYFVYDTPGALETEVLRDMNVKTHEYATLYSYYSWPNVFLSFVGGLLVDRVLGIRFGAIVFSCFILAGQLVVAFGAIVNRFWVMQLGRFIFGLGGENLGVTQNTYAVSWFRNKELNMVFGLQLSFARVGSTANFAVIGRLYDVLAHYVTGHTCLGVVLLIAASTCLFSLVTAVILAIIDKRAERILNKQAAQTGDVVKLSDALQFPLTFWMLTLICVSYYVSIFSFVGLSTVFFKGKYNLSKDEADFLAGFIYLISAVSSPIFGILVDRIGRNLIWIAVSTVITLVGHGLLAFTVCNPWYPICIMGLGYSILACALWPLVSLVIPEYQMGTAYGVMQSVQNLGMAVGPLIGGALVDLKGYVVLEMFFLACLCACMIFVIILFAVDISKRSGLNYSTHRRLQKAKLLESSDSDETVIAEPTTIIA